MLRLPLHFSDGVLVLGLGSFSESPFHVTSAFLASSYQVCVWVLEPFGVEFRAGWKLRIQFYPQLVAFGRVGIFTVLLYVLLLQCQVFSLLIKLMLGLLFIWLFGVNWMGFPCLFSVWLLLTSRKSTDLCVNLYLLLSWVCSSVLEFPGRLLRITSSIIIFWLFPFLFMSWFSPSLVILTLRMGCGLWSKLYLIPLGHRLRGESVVLKFSWFLLQILFLNGSYLVLYLFFKTLIAILLIMMFILS